MHFERETEKRSNPIKSASSVYEKQLGRLAAVFVRIEIEIMNAQRFGILYAPCGSTEERPSVVAGAAERIVRRLQLWQPPPRGQSSPGTASRLKFPCQCDKINIYRHHLHDKYLIQLNCSSYCSLRHAAGLILSMHLSFYKQKTLITDC